MILGSNDMLIRKYYTTLPKSTEKTIIIEGGTHFSCVTKQGMQRSEKWRRRLHIDKIPEPYLAPTLSRPSASPTLRASIRRRSSSSWTTSSSPTTPRPRRLHAPSPTHHVLTTTNYFYRYKRAQTPAPTYLKKTY